MKRYLCFDIGGTKIKYALLSRKAQYLKPTREIDTPSGEFILDAIMECIDQEINEGLDGVAISSAGVIDSVQGSVVYSGPTIPNYIGTEFKKTIEATYDIPVAVENDVNAALLGEYWQGAAKDSDSTVMLTVGTGVGGAIMIQNQLWHGSSLSAGEIGYIHQNGNHFQNLAASSVITKEVSENLGEDINGYELFERAKSGCQICIDAIDQQVSALCTGLCDIMYILNPETIILGGGIMQQVEYLEPRIHEAIDRIIIDDRFKTKKIKFAQLGNHAGMIGALYNLLK